MMYARRTVAWLFLVVLASGAAAHDAPQGEHAAMHEKGREFQVLKALPSDPGAYRAPVADLLRRGIPEKYGHEEWAAVVLSHELHQHIGIMTVVGAKMAVRAREILEAPLRAVLVTSETGPEPPFSCAIDGIQAGLGSTFAQQLIAAPKVETPRLAATFDYKGRRLRLALKPVCQERIRKYIRDAIAAHGNLTHDYFDAIEDNSYAVWAEFDRAAIFDEEEESSGE